MSDRPGIEVFATDDSAKVPDIPVTAPKPRLRDVEARAEGATEGPWAPYRTGKWPSDNYVTTPDLHGIATQWAVVWEPGDAAFIAAARTDVPALTAGYRAVLAVVDRWEQGQAENREALLHGGWCPYDPPSPADFRAALSAHIDLEES